MAEAILLAVAKSALWKLSSIHADLAAEHIGVNFAAANKTHFKVLEESLTKICDILIDVWNEPIDIYADTITEWVTEFSDVIYDVDDLLDEITTDARHQKRVDKGSLLRQVKSSFLLSKNSLLSRQLRDLCRKSDVLVGKIKDLVIRARPLDEYHYHHNHHDYGYKFNKSRFVFGREEDKQNIIKLLSSLSDDNHCSLFRICGDEGVGKTTLAELVYYDRWVRENFDLMLWVSDAGSLDQRKTMECIVNAVYGDGSWDLSLEMLEQRVFDAIRAKKFFLVLDHVRCEGGLVYIRLRDALKAGKRGSVILVTTQWCRQNASMSGEFIVGPLTEAAAWSMFCQLVFNGTEREKYPNLVEIGRSIIQKCHGIPLRIRLVGGMLGSIRDEKEWRRIADTLQPSTRECLTMVYILLPPHLRACCAYSHMFLTDAQIFSSHLINYWRAHGLLQEISSQEMGELGYNCFNELLVRSFLQDLTYLFNNCAGHVKMNDSVRFWLPAIIYQEAVVQDNSSMAWSTAKHVVLRRVNKSFFANVREKRLRTLKFDGEVRHVSRSLLERVISIFKKLRVTATQPVRESCYQAPA